MNHVHKRLFTSYYESIVVSVNRLLVDFLARPLFPNKLILEPKVQLSLDKEIFAHMCSVYGFMRAWITSSWIELCLVTITFNLVQILYMWSLNVALSDL